MRVEHSFAAMIHRNQMTAVRQDHAGRILNCISKLACVEIVNRRNCLICSLAESDNYERRNDFYLLFQEMRTALGKPVKFDGRL